MESVRKLVREILTEFMDKTDEYSAFLAAKKYARKSNVYLHFTDVYKLGINPKKQHADPHAIYFYPVKWIIDENNWSGFQYAVSMKYFFLCQVDTSNFLNLSKLTISEADRLMRTAGLYDIWAKYGEDFGKKPGKRFWSFLDMMNVEPSKRDNPAHHELPQVTWTQFWKSTGYDGFTDTKGIVNEQEPHQIGVINYKTIKILESGENKEVGSASMGFFDNIIKTYNIDVKQRGYLDNGNYYRILGSSKGKGIDIRIYKSGSYAIIYYNDSQGNVYQIKSEYTFNAYQARPNIMYAVESAIEKSETPEVNLKKLEELKQMASVIFNEVNGENFRSFGGYDKKTPVIFRKNADKYRDAYFFGGLEYDEEGKLILKFTFSTTKDLLTNPDSVEEGPQFDVNMYVESPEAALKKVNQDFEKWLASYDWRKGNPKAKLYFHRVGSAEKIREWFYDNIKKV